MTAPTAAPAWFPYHGHRTLAEVDADEARAANDNAAPLSLRCRAAIIAVLAVLAWLPIVASVAAAR